MSVPDNLIQKAITANALSWLDVIGDVVDLVDAFTNANYELDVATKKFVEDNPNHPIAKLTPKSDVEINKSINQLENILSDEYFAMKREQLEPTDTYYKTLESLIELNRQRMAIAGFTHPMYFNDRNIGDHNRIKELVSKMATVCKDKLSKVTHEFVETFNDNVTLEDVQALHVHFGDVVSFKVSSEHGSFMSYGDLNTARIHIKDTGSSVDMLRSTIHELGHALYQIDFLNKYTDIGQIGGCISLSLHETASILSELTFTGHEVVSISDQRNLYRLKSSWLVYVIHIFIRMQIEDELFDGTLNVRGISDRWNDLVEEYIGIRPSNDYEGFLQDVHWNQGAFGYFHSYAIGLIGAVYISSSDEYNELLSKLNPTDYAGVMESVVLPTIDKTFGRLDENACNIIESLYNDENELLDKFSSFVETKFTVVP